MSRTPRHQARALIPAAPQRRQLLYRRLDELKFNPRNARRHSDKQINQIAASIRAFGEPCRDIMLKRRIGDADIELLRSTWIRTHAFRNIEIPTDTVSYQRDCGCEYRKLVAVRRWTCWSETHVRSEAQNFGNPALFYVALSFSSDGGEMCRRANGVRGRVAVDIAERVRQCVTVRLTADL